MGARHVRLTAHSRVKWRAVVDPLKTSDKQASKAEESKILDHSMELTGCPRDLALAQRRLAGTVRVMNQHVPSDPTVFAAGGVRVGVAIADCSLAGNKATRSGARVAGAGAVL